MSRPIAEKEITGRISSIELALSIPGNASGIDHFDRKVNRFSESFPPVERLELHQRASSFDQTNRTAHAANVAELYAQAVQAVKLNNARREASIAQDRSIAALVDGPVKMVETGKTRLGEISAFYRTPSTYNLDAVWAGYISLGGDTALAALARSGDAFQQIFIYIRKQAGFFAGAKVAEFAKRCLLSDNEFRYARREGEVGGWFKQVQYRAPSGSLADVIVPVKLA